MEYLQEFELIYDTKESEFDEKDWARFERFCITKSGEKVENWQFEISSGYAGYRNTVTGDWIYEKDYLVKFGEKELKTEKLYTKEEVLEQLNLLYSMKNSTVDTFTDEDDRITMKWFERQ